MKKNLTIGVATLAIAGTALVGTSIYAASSASAKNAGRHEFQGQNGPQNMINSLSGKVSTEALTALQALMDKHKAEMIAARSNTGTIDKTAMEAQRTAFKAEIDALFAKYPELKTAMPTPPNGGMMMGREGRGGKQMETIIATLPSSAQTELQAIRDDYRTKQEALRTEEKTKTDAILASYPDIKTKLDALQKGHGPMENSRDIASKSNGQ